MEVIFVHRLRRLSIHAPSAFAPPPLPLITHPPSTTLRRHNEPQPYWSRVAVVSYFTQLLKRVSRIYYCEIYYYFILAINSRYRFGSLLQCSWRKDVTSIKNICSVTHSRHTHSGTRCWVISLVFATTGTHEQTDPQRNAAENSTRPQVVPGTGG